MEQHRHQKENKHHDLGRAIIFGAAIGLIAGLLLRNNFSLGMGVGAAIGLIIGTMMDVLQKKSG